MPLEMLGVKPPMMPLHGTLHKKCQPGAELPWLLRGNVATAVVPAACHSVLIIRSHTACLGCSAVQHSHGTVVAESIASDALQRRIEASKRCSNHTEGHSNDEHHQRHQEPGSNGAVEGAVEDAKACSRQGASHNVVKHARQQARLCRRELRQCAHHSARAGSVNSCQPHLRPRRQR